MIGDSLNLENLIAIYDAMSKINEIDRLNISTNTLKK
jgi:hypothetical protein